MEIRKPGSSENHFVLKLKEKNDITKENTDC